MTATSLLIVDDEPINLDAMRQALSGHYRMVFATNGPDALAATAKHRPALILLDIEMPGMDGHAVCRRLKADPETRAIPVIFVTSHDDESDEARGFEAGAVDYITKPIRPLVTRARIASHLQLIHASQLEQSHRDAITMLGMAGHYNDSDTGVHIWRMAAFARAIAEHLGWSREDCALLELAAPMHDTGKIGIPGSILRKPGKLDGEEWAVMKTHTTIGHSILSRSRAPVFMLAAELALHHHERWDGSGYPDGLAGTAIPESARIVAIADVFDALTMRRPYKQGWPLEQVLQSIRDGSGQHFEPRIVDALLACVPRLLEIAEHWRGIESREHPAG